MTAPTIEAAARRAYEAFVKAVGVYAPPEVPWEKLAPILRDAWIAATSAALQETLDRI